MEHVDNLQVQVTVSTEGDVTSASARLSVSGHATIGHGEAHRNPTDFDVKEIGKELAVARALADLGAKLIEATATDIEAAEGRPHSAHGGHDARSGSPGAASSGW